MTEPVTDTASVVDSDAVAEDTVVKDTPAYAEPSLHQPKRALIAAGEVVAVVVLAFVAVWAWNRGIVQLAVPDRGP